MKGATNGRLIVGLLSLLIFFYRWFNNVSMMQEGFKEKITKSDELLNFIDLK